MPTYDWHCQKCDANFETIESIKNYTGRGECPTCKNLSVDRIFSHQVYFIGASVEDATYNPAFGQVVKNSRQAREIAKEKGLIEIGTEKPETIHKHFDSQREEKLKKSWDEV